MYHSLLRSFLDSTLFLLVLPFVSASDSPPPKGNYTIWANDTISAMRAWRLNIYGRTLALYQHQTYFDDPINCLVPAPPDEYIENESCPRAGVLLSWAIQDIGSAWKYLAEAMFPVHFNLTDYANHTRALKTDFSHYYNELNLQAALLLNATHYYLCKYPITTPSALFRNLLAADADLDSYKTGPIGYRAIVFDGPCDPPPPPNSGIAQTCGANGTFQEYSGYYFDPFYLSYQAATANYGTAWVYASMLVDPSQGGYVPEPVSELCQQRLAEGIPKPVLESS